MNTPLPDTYLEEIQARHQRSTPGTWEHVVFPNGTMNFIRAPRLHPHDPYDIDIMGEDRNAETYPPEQALADGDFIAHAHQDVPALLEEISRLKREVVHMQARLDTTNALLDVSS